jgi:hypothetical protein
MTKIKICKCGCFKLGIQQEKKRVIEIINKETKAVKDRLNDLLFPMILSNVEICLNNLAVGIKQQIQEEKNNDRRNTHII